jgi:AhpD family alkylhydroperoxidase
MASATKNEVLREVEEVLGQVPQWIGELPAEGLASLWTMMRDFELAETKIPNKYKELIGLAVSGATRCRYCALFHTEAAKLFGATDAEIAEASMMASFTMCASTFINAQQIDYDKFRKETKEIANYVRLHQPTAKKMSGKPAHA